MLLFIIKNFYFLLGSLNAETDHFDQKIESYLQETGFWGSVLIAQDKEILFKKSFGFANLEHQIPNTPQTVFRLGSITKSFTAVAILQLQEQGLLDVHDYLDKYLPNYPQGNIITIHHLLCHTSGIPSITKLSNLADIQRHHSTVEQTLSHFKNLPLNFLPGTGCEYSDSNYLALGALIEKVTGLSYEEVLEKNIFSPSGMKATYFDSHSLIIPKRASGYTKDEKNKIVNSAYIDMSFPHAAGALASTVEDLHLFDQAIKKGKLLSKSSLEQLFSLQSSNEKNAFFYGYGFYIDTKSNSIGHRGGIEGFKASYYRYLDADLTIIILSNYEKTDVKALQQELSSLAWRS